MFDQSCICELNAALLFHLEKIDLFQGTHHAACRLVVFVIFYGYRFHDSLFFLLQKPKVFKLQK